MRHLNLHEVPLVFYAIIKKELFVHLVIAQFFFLHFCPHACFLQIWIVRKCHYKFIQLSIPISPTRSDDMFFVDSVDGAFRKFVQ